MALSPQQAALINAFLKYQIELGTPETDVPEFFDSHEEPGTPTELQEALAALAALAGESPALTEDQITDWFPDEGDEGDGDDNDA